MSIQETCPECGRQTVSETGGEVVVINDDWSQETVAHQQCSSCGWSNGPTADGG